MAQATHQRPPGGDRWHARGFEHIVNVGAINAQ
jgi:hypothetical protein